MESTVEEMRGRTDWVNVFSGSFELVDRHRSCLYRCSVFMLLLFLVLQKNAVIGGALAGAVMSAATGAGRNSRRDKVVKDAIAGAAIAAAAEFIGHRIRVDLGVVKSGDASSNKTSEGRSGAELYVWERRRQDVDPWVMGRGVELPLQFRTADPSS